MAEVKQNLELSDEKTTRFFSFCRLTSAHDAAIRRVPPRFAVAKMKGNDPMDNPGPYTGCQDNRRPKPREKAPPYQPPIAKLIARIDLIEANQYALRDGTFLDQKKQNSAISELKAKLRQTIKAVEKLAKGKSLGALGLPSEEEWDHPL